MARQAAPTTTKGGETISQGGSLTSRLYITCGMCIGFRCFLYTTARIGKEN